MTDNLFILKSVVEDTSITNEAFSVWCALRYIVKRDEPEQYVSYGLLAYVLYDRVVTRSESDKIIKGLNELIDNGYVKVVYQISKTEFKLDLSELIFTQGSAYFCDLRKTELTSIMNLQGSCNIDRCKVLRYFAFLIGSFNRSKDFDERYRGKVCGLPREYYAESIGISKNSTITYSDLLMKNKILFYIVSDDFYQTVKYNGESEVRQLVNIYSRYEDRHLATELAYSKHGYKYYITEKAKKQKQANKNRGLGNKYNRFMNGRDYPLAEMIEIREWVMNRNESDRMNYEKELSRGYSPSEPEYRDITKIDKYIKCLVDNGDKIEANDKVNTDDWGSPDPLSVFKKACGGY